VPFTYPYPRPAVTCDTVVFAMRADDLAVLLIQRRDDPFKGQWALPGGFVDENEPLQRAAVRELDEEAGLSGLRLEQLGAFGDPGRDPRGHTVTVAWMTFLLSEAATSAGDDAAAVGWHPFRSLEVASRTKAAAAKATRARAATRKSARVKLAFDHAQIIAAAYRRLCQHLDDPLRTRAFDLLPSRFTLAELRHLYELVLGRALPPRTFNRRFVEHGIVVPASAKPTKKAAAQLYRWNRL